ncbi:MAG TPA: TrmH family RNA methyltransferase [bacterium]|nr:TrmH family RNA methyltransferase [bacterium]
MNKLTVSEIDNKKSPADKRKFSGKTKKRRTIHVLLDNIRSAYNVGAFFRIADGAGNVKLHLCGITPTPPNKKILKTSLDSESTVEWEYYKNSTDAIDALKDIVKKIYAVEVSKNAEKYTDVDYSDDILLVFGHEINGVSENIIDQCDRIIMIPMAGIKTSLNVETAGGIIIFEAKKDD